MRGTISSKHPHQSVQQPTRTMIQANPALDHFSQLMVKAALCVVQSD